MYRYLVGVGLGNRSLGPSCSIILLAARMPILYKRGWLHLPRCRTNARSLCYPHGIVESFIYRPEYLMNWCCNSGHTAKAGLVVRSAVSFGPDLQSHTEATVAFPT